MVTPSSKMPVRLSAIIVALCLLPLACGSLCDPSWNLTRYVSATNGTNSPECLNSTQARSFPCRSLPYALLGEDEGIQYPDYCNYSSGPDNLCVRLEDGVHWITGELQVTNVSNLVIEAVNSSKAQILCRLEPNVYDNLAFFCSRNVTLSGVVVEECGPVSPGLYVYDSDGVTIQDCVFRNISATAIDVQESNNLVVRNCLFEGNINNATTNEHLINKSFIDLNELNVYSNPGGALSVYSSNAINLVIENCTFSDNKASDRAIDDRRPPLLQLDGHGGAVFIRLIGTNGSSVFIRNTTFERNIARIQGGAIYVSMSHEAASNSFVVEDCNFTNNSAETRAGGALAIVLFNATLNNTFMICGSIFRGNSAVGGGAVAVIQYDIHSTEYRDMVIFENCLFKFNTAEREGSAVELFSLVHNDQEPFPANFSNCSFYNNSLRGMPTLAEVNEFHHDPGGALSSFRYPIKLSGHTKFCHNIGGGLSVLNTKIDVEKNAQVLFQENKGIFGGGIQMEERCRLLVSPGAKMNFTNNFAYLGGAIYAFSFLIAEFAEYFRNRLCIIQYNDPQQEDDVPTENWQNVSIVFVDNFAKIGGAALYVSDIRGCFWMDSSLDIDERYTIFIPPPTSSSPFMFSGNQLLNDSRTGLKVVTSETFASDSLSIEVMFASGKTVFAQPGEDVLFFVVCKDFFNNSRTCLLSVSEANQLIQSSQIVLNGMGQSFHFRVPAFAPGNGSVSTKEAPQSQLQLEFGLPLSKGKSANFSLNVRYCHPGYRRGRGGLCECDTDNPDILRCDTNGRYLFVRGGVYAYVSNESRELTVINGAPPGYTSCDRVGRLPGCRFKFDEPDAQCGSGRTGFLCGSCPSGSWVSLDILSCSDTCEVGIVLFFIWCAVVICASVFVLILDIGHPAELRAFIFYAEVIGCVFFSFTTNDSKLSLSGLGYFLSLFSLSIPIPWCVSQTLPAHIVALLGYIPPLLILGTVIIYIICARYVSAISSRSALHGLSLLGLFIYVYTANVSFLFISCRVTNGGYVYLYDGTQSCQAANFVPFLVLAVLVIFCFVLVAPFLLCLLTKKRWTAFNLYHFTDEVSRGMHPSRHWYAGWDIGRRLLLVLAHHIGLNLQLDIPLLAIINFLVVFVVLLVQVFAKPYKDTHNNIIETAILVNFVLVAASYLQSPDTTTASVMVIILTLLPYVYAVVYIAIATGRKIHKKYKEHKEKYSPSDAAAANKKEGRDTIEMTTLANTADLQQDTESPKSPVAITGPSTATGVTTATTITTASSIVSEATTTKHAPPTTGGTGKASAAVDPFHLSEDQISLNRGMF